MIRESKQFDGETVYYRDMTSFEVSFHSNLYWEIVTKVITRKLPMISP